MNMSLKALLTSLVLAWLTSCSPVHAEPSERDQKLSELMRSRPKSGLVVVDATLTELGKSEPWCHGIRMTFKSDSGATETREIQTSPYLWGKPREYSTFGDVAVLDAGNYTIAVVGCAIPSQGFVLNGPFAKFSLQAGQMLNLGRLDIVYEMGGLELWGPRKFKGDWRVVDLSARAAASLRKRIPETLSRAKKQNMTVIRAAPKS